MSGFLGQAFVYLSAAVIAVPLARRFGLGSVLGYLIAGIAIGPFGLELVGENGQDVLHFAEFGVVMMLFVIGLELEPALLWRLRGPILGMGGLQVLLSGAGLAGIGVWVGLPWREAVAVGMILSLSSTAIVLQTLGEKGQLETSGGRSAFSVLLFQDIAVIPMLALLPLLGSGHAGDASHGAEAGYAESASLLVGLPGWVQTLVVLGAVGGIVVGGRYLIRPVLRAIGRTRSREIFTAAALMLVIGIALLMQSVGLSPALGTFLAGVVLATSEYRHELESDIDPFKGLLLGLFFLAVGASIDFGLIAESPGLIVGLALGVMALKFIVLLALAKGFGLATDPALLFAFALPQAGEFAFVLFSFATQEGVLGYEIVDPLVAAVALSMALTPLLLLANDRLVRPRFGTREGGGRPMDRIEHRAPVLIAGFGSFGATVGRLLRAKNVPTVVLEYDSDRVDLLRELGLEVYYGDATRHDLLEVAGARDARLLVIALPDPGSTLALVRTAKKHFPGLKIYARAFDWPDAHDLMDEGVEYVYRQSLDSALRAGREILSELGFRRYQAQRAAQTFLRHEEQSLKVLQPIANSGNRTGFLSAARARIEDLDRVLRMDLEESTPDRDRGWDPDSLRSEFGAPEAKEP
jgi:CPA2 family monovalent cation:H+ antiporter-2/glutathione-regulated potassium-efflux system protein KefB